MGYFDNNSGAGIPGLPSWPCRDQPDVSRLHAPLKATGPCCSLALFAGDELARPELHADRHICGRPWSLSVGNYGVICQNREPVRLRPGRQAIPHHKSKLIAFAINAFMSSWAPVSYTGLPEPGWERRGGEDTWV